MASEDYCPHCKHITPTGKENQRLRNKEKPIYGTNLNVPLSITIEDVRMGLMKMRGIMSDIEYAFPVWNQDMKTAHGWFTTGLVYLHNVRKRMLEGEQRREKITHNPDGSVITVRRYKLKARPMGMDHSPGCFVCGGEQGMYENTSFFVDNKEEGEGALTLFKHGARLDYRSYEPQWVQLKVGACEVHTKNLNKLVEKIYWNSSMLEQLHAGPVHRRRINEGDTRCF